MEPLPGPVTRYSKRTEMPALIFVRRLDWLSRPGTRRLEASPVGFFLFVLSHSLHTS
jgi:hypothetical protein